ncbi:MAG: HAD family hydrolase [Clostridia bacterium]|nr:HAD family hydrolase [Clostridia bacterium]
MIKAVVFDLDHTLFDRYETLRKIVPHFRDYFDISDGVTDEFIYENLSWADRQFVHRGWEEIHTHLIDIGVFNTPPEFNDYTEYLLSWFRKIAVKYEFSEDILNALREKGYKTGIITNGDHETQTGKLELLGFKNLVDEVIISGDIGIYKPDKRIFENMAQRLSVDINEMMYVGDHPKFDVDGSRRAGCVPVWVKTTGTWIFPEIEKCKYQIENVSEIFNVLNDINAKGN